MNLCISSSKVSSSVRILNDMYNLYKLTLCFTFVNAINRIIQFCKIFYGFKIQKFELPQIKILY